MRISDLELELPRQEMQISYWVDEPAIGSSSPNCNFSLDKTEREPDSCVPHRPALLFNIFRHTGLVQDLLIRQDPVKLEVLGHLQSMANGEPGVLGINDEEHHALNSTNGCPAIKQSSCNESFDFSHAFFSLQQAIYAASQCKDDTKTKRLSKPQRLKTVKNRIKNG
ncbi:unnamed protein product [Clonostachys chloroleuca]|uniref:Uncharacterized protein n=1 Tax=Clonostachys chloroleuca TaxID=1926264 RepID=A0AA35M9E9_9HYPO|nr:unnamed protein product [Clonostachys chloroleuca]